MFRNEINVTMRPSVKEVKSFIVFHNHVNVMIYSALSSADDPLMILQLMIERGRSTGGRARKIHYWSGRRRSTSGASAEDPLVERAQKIHWWSGRRQSTWWSGRRQSTSGAGAEDPPGESNTYRSI